ANSTEISRVEHPFFWRPQDAPSRVGFCRRPASIRMHRTCYGLICQRRTRIRVVPASAMYRHSVSRSTRGRTLSAETKHQRQHQGLCHEVGLEATVKSKRKYLKSNRRRQESTNGSRG